MNSSIWKVMLMPSRHYTECNTLRDNALQTHTQQWSIVWNRSAAATWCAMLVCDVIIFSTITNVAAVVIIILNVRWWSWARLCCIWKLPNRCYRPLGALKNTKGWKSGAELGGCQGGHFPPKILLGRPSGPPKIRYLSVGHFLKVLHRPLTAPLVAKPAPPVAPPNENVWLRPWIQAQLMELDVMQSKFVAEATIHIKNIIQAYVMILLPPQAAVLATNIMKNKLRKAW